MILGENMKRKILSILIIFLFLGVSTISVYGQKLKNEEENIIQIKNKEELYFHKKWFFATFPNFDLKDLEFTYSHRFYPGFGTFYFLNAKLSGVIMFDGEYILPGLGPFGPFFWWAERDLEPGTRIEIKSKLLMAVCSQPNYPPAYYNGYFIEFTEFD